MRGRRTLSGNREFRAVYSRGRRSTSDGITAIVLPTPGGVTRLGLAVPARSAGAVARNRARRRLREALRMLALPEGYQVVIRTDVGAARAPFSEVRTHLRAALEGAGMKGLAS